MGFMTSSHIPSDNPLYHDTLELLIALVQNACVNDFTPRQRPGSPQRRHPHRILCRHPRDQHPTL